MNGQSFVLLAVGVFAALVVTVATINSRLLEEHPPSEASGLLWRVERALNTAQDLELELTSTQSTSPAETVRMDVRVVVSPVPVLSVRYLEPESLRDQVLIVENDLLSHYVPADDLVVIKRWTGVPLAAVGLAGLDVSQLRADLQRGVVTARVLGDETSLSNSSGADVSLGATLAGTPLDTITEVEDSSLSTFDPSLPGFALAPPGGVASSIRGSYVIEVRDAASGQLTRALWIDRATYLIEKIVYFQDDQRVRSLEVEDVRINQGLTPDDVLARPRVSVTIRG